MLSARLRLAIDDGLVAAPVTLVGPDASDDLTDLPRPATLVTRMQPDHDALAARGFDVATTLDGTPDTVIVCLPRARAEAQDRIARAMDTGARVLVDGQKTSGVDAILKACRARGTVGTVLSKAHGKIFALTGGDFADWRVAPARNADGFLTAPGSFSADGIDPGSAALADALPPLKSRVADLGAGWGYLAGRVLARGDVASIDLIEADLAALDCARANVDDPRAAFHWADATRFSAAEPFHHVVSNPPFHRGRAGEPDLGRAFIAAAARLVAPRGTFWMVANRHLPYERTLDDHFAERAELPGTGAFKLYRAARPRRPR